MTWLEDLERECDETVLGLDLMLDAAIILREWPGRSPDDAKLGLTVATLLAGTPACREPLGLEWLSGVLRILALLIILVDTIGVSGNSRYCTAGEKELLEL